MRKSCVIIPARYHSSRFPGKPLVEICGKPMVVCVADIASQAVGINHVYVATDDERISDVAKKYGYKALMTDSNLMTGTDRVAQAASQLDYDVVVNVQGDEPTLNYKDIQTAIKLSTLFPDTVFNGYTCMGPMDIASSLNIPKVVMSCSGRLLYASRAKIPSSKTDLPLSHSINKQVCIYSFRMNHLDLFSSQTQKTPLENIEDIEILRFLELDIPVTMFPCSSGSLAVDEPRDLEKVINYIKKLRQK